MRPVSTRVVVLSIAAAALVAVGVAADRHMARKHVEVLRASVIEHGETLRAEVEGNIAGKGLLLKGLTTAIRSSDTLGRARFEQYAGLLIDNYPEIVSVAAAPNLVVEHVFPRTRQNRSVIGLDYRTTTRMDDIAKVRDAGRTVISGPMDLLRGDRGYVLRVPIFVGLGEGEGRFWGIISVVMDEERFNRNAGLLDTDPTIDIALRGVGGSGAAGAVFLGDPALFDRDPVTLAIDLPYGSWQLAVAPAAGWAAPAGFDRFAWAVFAAASVMVLAVLNFGLAQRSRMRRAESRLASAVEALDDGFVLYDEQDRFVTCNQRYREIYSLSADLFVPGTSFEDILREGVRRGQYPGAVGCEEDWIAERLAAHTRADSDFEQQLSNGRWLKISERRTVEGGIVGYRVDVTQLKEAHAAAEAANNAKTRFINVLSHELRTPLTVVLGYTSILSNPMLFPAAGKLTKAIDDGSDAPTVARLARDQMAEMRNYAGRIETSGNHLLHLINELLDFSKIETGNLEVEITDFRFDKVAEAVAEQFRFMSTRKDVEMICEVPALAASGDPIRTQQVLVNLVGNALKFTDSGHVSIRATEENGAVIVRVQDTGCGIPEDMQDRVFEEFQQADGSSTRRAGGTGLGLAIVRRIVEMQRGRVWLTSREGEGTTVHFTLPVAEDDSLLLPEPETATDAGTGTAAATVTTLRRA